MTRGAAAVDALVTMTVEPERWQATVAEVLERGGTVQALFAARGPGGAPEVRCLARAPQGSLLMRCPAPGHSAPSLVGLAPSLQWDEREARDLHGIAFAGHDPHRALVAHPAELGAWITPIVGDDVHQVAVGPIHAGVIESGHFRFHCVGEQVLHIDTRLFHKHRGLERAAEGMSAPAALALVQRACAACAVANTVAFAHAVEQASGRGPDTATRRARTLLIELERLYNHLNDLGAICAGVGFAPGAMAFAAFKEQAQRVVRDLTGHRFMFGAVAVGESRLEVPAAVVASARSALAELAGEVTPAWRALLFDASLRDRVVGAGVLPREEAVRLGTVGPAARASGARADAREESPRLWYPGFRAALPAEPAGDVAARMEARALELAQTFPMLDELLGSSIGPGTTVPEGPPSADGAGWVESARGGTTCVVELEGDRVLRVHLRTSSFANWPSVARAASGGLLSDFPLVNKSFELCYACVDR